MKNTMKRARDCARDVKNILGLKTSVLASKRRGDILKRMVEFGLLFENCEGKKILDIGCYDGLIAYEFFRNGASTIHGIDNDAYHLDTAARIFSQVDITSKFVRADLRKSQAIEDSLAADFAGTYDIVLFLGVFQHIYKKMSQTGRQSLVDTITSSARDLLAIRIPDHTWSEFEQYFPSGEFSLLQQTPQKGTVGEFRIYKRT